MTFFHHPGTEKSKQDKFWDSADHGNILPFPIQCCWNTMFRCPGHHIKISKDHDQEKSTKLKVGYLRTIVNTTQKELSKLIYKQRSCFQGTWGHDR